MDYTNEKAEHNAKESINKGNYASQYAGAATQSQSGMIGRGAGLDEPCRAGLKDRVSMQLRRASSEARKVERLLELNMLLEKHPDIARILDLVEEVRS